MKLHFVFWVRGGARWLLVSLQVQLQGAVGYLDGCNCLNLTYVEVMVLMVAGYCSSTGLRRSRD
jgi:hypothetical protein